MGINADRGNPHESRRGVWDSVNDLPFGRMVRLFDFASAAVAA